MSTNARLTGCKVVFLCLMSLLFHSYWMPLGFSQWERGLQTCSLFSLFFPRTNKALIKFEMSSFYFILCILTLILKSI